MTRALEALRRGASEILGRPLTDHEAGLFGKYLDLLIKWQRSQRLIGSSNPRWIVDHLLLDSMLFLKVLPGEFKTILDLGSGAGFPGIPIKIAHRNIELTMVESRRKRTSFLSAVIRDLGLANVRVINARVEEVVEELRGSFDVVVVRCVRDPGEVLPAADTLLRHGGVAALAGAPQARPLSMGRWAKVPGVRAGHTRNFVVYRKP